MQKLLRLLMLLSGKRKYTLAELIDRFDVSERTIYRYLDTIETTGFVLEREDGHYRLKEDDPAVKDLNQLLHFSEEEAFLFYQTLGLLEGTTPVKEQLLRKLNSLYDFRALQSKPGNDMENIQVLSEAMECRQQVSLCGYRSSNSQSTTDRTVEAFEFMPDYLGFWCYDTESDSCKQFKITRLADVKILSVPWQHTTKHIVPFTDAFHMAALEPIAVVKAKLTMKAYNLMVEEYPLTKPYLKLNDGSYCLELPIADFNGIGRFVRGMAREVEVLEPEEFKKYLKES